jgi:hypothetical protein
VLIVTIRPHLSVTLTHSWTQDSRYKWLSQSNTFRSLFNAVYRVVVWKFHSTHTMMLLKAQLFFHIASIFVDSFLPPLDKGMYSVPEKVSTPPAHQLEHSILQCLSHHWCNGDLMDFFFFKGQTSYSLMVWGLDCRVAAVSIHILWWFGGHRLS